MVNRNDYDLTNDDIHFLKYIEECCVNGQNKLTLKYKDNHFEIIPHGRIIEVVNENNTVDYYNGFDDFALNHSINGKALIEIVKYLDFSE